MFWVSGFEEVDEYRPLGQLVVAAGHIEQAVLKGDSCNPAYEENRGFLPMFFSDCPGPGNLRPLPSKPCNLWEDCPR